MGIVPVIQKVVSNAIKSLYQLDLKPADIQVNETKPDFEGDYTVVLFTLTKPLRKQPELIGKELGNNILSANATLFSSFNVIKGFLNLSISDQYWLEFLYTKYALETFGFKKPSGKKVMVEYSSPNTNKPLHLGHLRNNFLGWSSAEIDKAHGSTVIKTCIVNDRGIHICKSMLAWKKFGNGSTPEPTGIKGDHFVGDFYVLFENELRKQAEPILQQVMKGDLAYCDEADQ